MAPLGCVDPLNVPEPAPAPKAFSISASTRPRLERPYR